MSAQIIDHPVSLNITMAAELPTGFSGYWANEITTEDNDTVIQAACNFTCPSNIGPVPVNIVSYPNNNLTGYVTESWLDDTPLLRTVHGCPSTCTVKLTAPALFQTQCSSHTIKLEPEQVWDLNGAAPFSADGFVTATQLVVSEGYEWIDLVTGYATAKDCKGTMILDICTLEAGVGEYDATVHEDGGTTLDSAVPKLLALSNNTGVNNSTVFGDAFHPSTLGGIVYIHQIQFSAAFSWFVENGTIQARERGSVPFGLVAVPDPTGQICQSYKSPQDRLMKSLNKAMVYSGAHAAAQWGHQLDTSVRFPINTTTTGYLHGSRPVFSTDYWFFLAAAILLLVCIALIIPTYWGGWNLGRPVSFSPLETAKAFESPLLAEINSNASGRDIANAVELVEVQYGARGTTATNQGAKLAFADPAEVAAPQNGCRYGV